jgi:hypothetical protein
MKKKVLYAVALLMMASLFNSCEDSCKTCSYVIYDSNDEFVRSELAAEYCGADLIARQAAPDVVVGEGDLLTTTKFECD